MIWFILSLVTIITWTFFALSALTKKTNELSVGQWFRQRDPVRGIAYLALIVISITAIFGYYSQSVLVKIALSGFSSNWFSDLVFLVFTLLIIDRLVERRNKEQEKERIIRQMASHSNEFALEATRLARDYGWLENGSLVGVTLRYANLSAAKLWGANLEGTKLGYSILMDSNLGGANLKNAELLTTNLQNANLRYADLDGADLTEANLSRANLRGAVLKGAELRSANLSGANLTFARLTNANLSGADLSKADLAWAHLQHADLKFAKLEGASMEQANFEGARLTATKFTGAEYSNGTIWPEGFDPEKAGAILVRDVEDVEL